EEPVDLVVEAIVLRVSAFGAHWIGLKPRMLYSVIVRFLRHPANVVAEVFPIDALLVKDLGVHRQIALEIDQRHPLLKVLTNRLAPQQHVANVAAAIIIELEALAFGVAAGGSVARGLVANLLAVFSRHLSIKNQRDVELGRHLSD